MRSLLLCFCCACRAGQLLERRGAWTRRRLGAGTAAAKGRWSFGARPVAHRACHSVLNAQHWVAAEHKSGCCSDPRSCGGMDAQAAAEIAAPRQVAAAAVVPRRPALVDRPPPSSRDGWLLGAAAHHPSWQGKCSSSSSRLGCARAAVCGASPWHSAVAPSDLSDCRSLDVGRP